MKRSFFQAAVALILLYGCTTWTLTKRLEKKLDGNYTRMMRAILNKYWRQHPTRHQLYGHLPPITKTIQVRQTRHAGHCWKSRDELIIDVLLWTPTHGRAKAGRPARTYIQQLCEDTGCCPEDLPEAMNDREKWRERVRDIHATSTIWWWWMVLYSHMQYHNDTIIKTQKDFFIKYILLNLFARVRKGCVEFYCERELETEQKLQYFDPHSYGRQRCVFLVLQGCSTGGPEAHSVGWWLSYCILSATSLGPFGLAWLSLPHLISNLTPTVTPTVWLLSWLSYIIVQRPLNLWNGMFDRHQAEISVMQFIGHSLPVHHLVPYNQPSSSAQFPLITAIGMCHFLPVYHFEWHFWPGRRSKYNNGTCTNFSDSEKQTGHFILAQRPNSFN